MRALLTLCLLFVMFAPVRTWDGHDHITAAAIESLGWFDEFSAVPATPADHAQLEPVEPRNRIVAATLPALKLTGQSIRGFLEAARPDIVRWMRRAR